MYKRKKKNRRFYKDRNFAQRKKIISVGIIVLTGLLDDALQACRPLKNAAAPVLYRTPTKRLTPICRNQ